MKTDKPRAIRVAIVGGSLSSHGGGAPRSMASQANALATQGIDSSFFVGYSKRYPLTPDQLHVSSEIVASPLWGPSVLGLAPSALIRLSKRAAEFGFIHLNGAWNLTSYLAARIAVKNNVPFIVSGRSHYGEYHYSRYRMLKPALYHSLERYKIKNAAAIHVTSQWEKETSRPLIGEAKTVSIPNSVDLKDFRDHITRSDARRRLGLPPDSPVFVHLGRLGEQKNLGFLVKAFLASNPSSYSSKLVLIGPPEGATKAKLKRILSRSEHSDCVRFVDFAKGIERKLWLSAANLFVLPSWDENFCVAAIEAVACGTHCLVSSNVGAIEYLPKSSITVLPLNSPDWQTELKAHQKTSRDQRFPPNEILNQFSLDRVGNLWANAYKSLLHSSSNRDTT